MSKKSKIDVAIAVAEGYLSTDNIIAYGESRSCALAVAGLVEVVKLCADELTEFRHREARAAIEADSPEIAAAEARGRMEELKALRFIVSVENDMLKSLRLIGIMDSIDARVAYLQAEKEDA